MDVFAKDVFLQAFIEAIKPRLKITVADWAAQNRILTSKASSEKGLWRNSRTPYLIEPMNHMSSDSNIEEIDLMFGAQLGKTESIINGVGFTIDMEPCPIMMVMPDDGNAKKFSKQRIEPLLSTSEVIKTKMINSSGNDAKNTLMEKDFLGGILVIVGANAPAGLASTPIKKLFMDEIDRYPDDVGYEGDPTELAIKRTATFLARKIVRSSTPTIKGQSKIENSYLKSDQRKYFVPCPHCKKLQELKFKNLQWEKGNYDSVLYYCEHCGEGIKENQKTWMLNPSNGACWKPTATSENPKKIGYHMSSLYSPYGWLSWPTIAREWEHAQGNDNKLKVFLNTILAETFQMKGESPEWEILYNRCESYSLGIVPKNASAITMGVDVQGDRLEAHIKAWGRNNERWTVDYKIFYGDTSDLTIKGPWNELSKLIQKEFPHENGSKLRLMATAIDSGHHTSKVYKFVKKHAILKVYAIKGKDNFLKVVGTAQDGDIKENGRVVEHGAKYRMIGTNLLKNEVYSSLKKELPDETEILEKGYPNGYNHFPEMSEDFFKQLTAEEKVPVIKNGFKKIQWVKKYGRNEVLDTECYALVASYLAGIQSFSEKKWERLETKLGVTPLTTPSDSIEVDLPLKRKKKIKRPINPEFEIDLNF